MHCPVHYNRACVITKFHCIFKFCTLNSLRTGVWTERIEGDDRFTPSPEQVTGGAFQRRGRWSRRDWKWKFLTTPFRRPDERFHLSRWFRTALPGVSNACSIREVPWRWYGKTGGTVQPVATSAVVRSTDWAGTERATVLGGCWMQHLEGGVETCIRSLQSS